jgi:hypothetical protein
MMKATGSHSGKQEHSCPIPVFVSFMRLGYCAFSVVVVDVGPTYLTLPCPTHLKVSVIALADQQRRNGTRAVRDQLGMLSGTTG